MDKHIENLTTIQYCIEKIEEKLSHNSLENRWLWEVRYKIALYVHNYLKIHDKENKSDRHVLSEGEKKEIIKNHPLMQPFDQASIGITNEQRNKIQKEIYDKVHNMYLFHKENDK